MRKVKSLYRLILMLIPTLWGLYYLISNLIQLGYEFDGYRILTLVIIPHFAIGTLIVMITYTSSEKHRRKWMLFISYVFGPIAALGIICFVIYLQDFNIALYPVLAAITTLYLISYIGDVKKYLIRGK